MTAEASSRAAAGEAGFQLLADHLPDLILLAFDPELVMWAATGGALRARGWTPEQFIGLTVPEIVGSTRAEDIDACCRTALAGEIAQLDLDGYDDPSRLWSLHFVPLADAGNAVSGGMVLCRDVTEQRQAEQLLEANRRQLAEAQRIAQVGSWEWDLVADEVTLSDEFCRIFGLPVGSHWTMEEGVAQLIPGADLERVGWLLDRMRAAGFAIEYTGHHNRLARLAWFDRTGRELGELAPPAIYISPTLSPDGRQVAVSLVEDVSMPPDVWIYDVALRTGTITTSR